MQKKMKTAHKRPSKYDEMIRIDATMEEVAQTIFMGKPKKLWRFIQDGKKLRKG